MTVSDYLLSVIRTAVPAGWGALAAWLASIGVDAGAEANVAAVTFLTGAAVALYYAGVRALEPKLPAWLRVVLIGAARKPEYAAPAPAYRAYQNAPGRPGRGA
jgi:hypothetical protein